MALSRERVPDEYDNLTTIRAESSEKVRTLAAFPARLIALTGGDSAGD